MSVPNFRVGANRPRLVLNLICLSAMLFAIAAWQFSVPLGITGVMVTSMLWLLIAMDRPEGGHGLLRSLPRRTSPVPLHVASEEPLTVWAKLLAGETLMPPSPVEGMPAAWSVDLEEVDANFTDRVSSTTPLVLENAEGARFCIEPGWDWVAVTSQWGAKLDPLSEERIVEVRRDLALHLPSASYNPDFVDADLALLVGRFAWKSFGRQSVFFVGQWVAVTGSFSPHPNAVFRGQPMPTFRMRYGQIDDCSLDA